MAEYICPSCGKDLPSALGQHATDLISALVTCPHCGAEVTLREGAVESPSGNYAEADAAPPSRTEGSDEFAGNETIEALAEELQEKYR
jgi:DNA-directed RNA polymerase subunit RPC12/RpoP